MDSSKSVTNGLESLNLNSEGALSNNGIMDNNPYGALADLEDEEEKEDTIKVVSPPKKERSTPADSVAKELSQLNDQVNRMKLEQIKKKLRQFNLDTKGTRTVLQKRLKTHYRRIHVKEPDHQYKYFVVIDFEATCDAAPTYYRHEIIEFPAVLVSTKKGKIVDKFHSYVRPLVNPKLTTFCTNLTGITQDKVNFAPIFPEVLKKFDEWLKEKHLLTDFNSFAIVTDGPWDMGRFLFMQCKMSKVTYPPWAKTWINIKKPFCNFYNTERMTLQQMLTQLGMSFIGQPHCGSDDAYNIARVALKLYEDGANMRVNEQINFKKSNVIGHRLQTVRNISRNQFSIMIRRRALDPKPEGARESSSENEEEQDSDQDVDDNENKANDTVASCYENNFPSLRSKPLRDSH